MFSETEYDTMEEVIAGMLYKPFTNGDTFYPSEEDIDRMGTVDQTGGKTYSKDEVMYLHWLIQFPSKDRYPRETLPVRNKIRQILGDIDLFKEAV